MTAGLTTALLLFAAYASGSARYIDGGFNTNFLYNSSPHPVSEVDNGGVTDKSLFSSVSAGNEVVTTVSVPVISSSAAILQAEATADAIAEIAAAETSRAKAAAQAKMDSLRMAAARLSVQKTYAEAELRSHSAEIHAAKAGAASKRKLSAMAEEEAELFAARQDGILVEKLKKAAAQILRISEQESAQSQEIINELQREAAAHEARAAVARAKADAAASAAGLLSLTAPAGLSAVSTSSDNSFASDNKGDSFDVSGQSQFYNNGQFVDGSNSLNSFDLTSSSYSYSY